MRSLFVALVAAFLAVSFTTVLAQSPPPAANNGLQKAIEARAKQMEDAAKGVRRAVEAEAKLKAEAAALAPKVIAAQSHPCVMSEAAPVATVGGRMLIEVACSNMLGFQSMSAADGSRADLQACITNFSVPLPPCKLPSNSEAAAAASIQALATRAGSDCQVQKVIEIGTTAQASLYEVSCTNGVGEVLQASLPRTNDSRVISQTCLRIASTANYKCTLSTEEANARPIRALAAKTGQACTVNAHRYVGATTSGAEIYELGCSEGKSFMVQADPKGNYQRMMTCVQASGIGGGCTLSDAKAELANALAGYTNLVKAAGFDCTVAKFASFPAKEGLTEAVEVGCSNRTESGIALIAAGKTEVLNCARARVEGYSCSYSKPEDAYKLMTENLKQAGKTTCEVNGVRSMGAGSRAVYIEVSCADGDPGFVMSYPPGVGKPAEAISCGQATGLGGGCQMPANKKT